MSPLLKKAALSFTRAFVGALTAGLTLSLAGVTNVQTAKLAGLALLAACLTAGLRSAQHSLWPDA